MAETNNIIEKVKERILSAENILVALSKDPAVDEMAAAIGLTMALDQAGKHATAIYSGQTPNVLQFLKPEKTFEVDTNSLQDFIIALNKEKADHLRYKIEGEYVRVYITPYKTRISESDLEFSHGDFNVDLVVALNIASAENLDAALTEYGRIMHDATSINITTAADAGSFAELAWNDPAKSSVSEMLVELLQQTKEMKIEKDVATALLTGIVAATDRFSNGRTTPDTMMVASELMKLGADQKLIVDSMKMDSMDMSGGGSSETIEEQAEVKKEENKVGDLAIGHKETAGSEAQQEENNDSEAQPMAGQEGGNDGGMQPMAEQEGSNDGGMQSVAGQEGGNDEEVKSATEQLEQMIRPTEEESALEQLRQVANDVKLPEFQPGQNPAEVVAPDLTEKEANDIPEMNFGGTEGSENKVEKQGGVTISPPSEEGTGSETTINLASDAGSEATVNPSSDAGSEATVNPSSDAGSGDAVNIVPPSEQPQAELPLVKTAEDTTTNETKTGSEEADEMPVLGLEDIQLPPPPAPPVGDVPSIEIKQDATLGEEPKAEDGAEIGGAGTEGTASTEMNGIGAEGAVSTEMGGTGVEGAADAAEKNEDPGAFKIPGM